MSESFEPRSDRQPDYDGFFAAVSNACGEGVLERAPETLTRYGENHLPTGDVQPPAVVLPRDTAQVVEIVRAAFDCEPVSEIVETYRAHFGGTRNRPGVAVGEELPLGARLLAIADAWDSMKKK